MRNLFIVIAVLGLAMLVYKTTQENEENVAVLKVDHESHKLANDINIKLESLKGSLFAKSKNRILYLLNTNKGFNDLIDMQSGVVDGYSSSAENYKGEFKCFALSNSEFESMVSMILRNVEIECLNLLKESLIQSNSPLFHERILEKATWERENVGNNFSIVPITNENRKLIGSAVSNSYKKFVKRDLTEKLTGGVTKDEITSAVLDGISAELKISIDSIISSWKLKAEEHDHSFFSDITYEENIKEKAFAKIHHLAFLKKAQNSFSENINEFTHVKLKESRLSDFLDRFSGLWDGTNVALKNEQEKSEYITQEFEKYIFSSASLKKLFNDTLKECRLLATEEANECAFQLESLRNPKILKGNPIDLKIPHPKSDIPMLVQVAEMSEQLATSIEAGAFIAGIVYAPVTGGQSLWVSLVVAIYEVFRLIGDFTVVEAEKVIFKAELRDISASQIIEKQAAQSIAKLNLDVEKVFNYLIAK